VNNLDDQSQPIGQAYLVDYDSATGLFTNWKSFTYPNGVNFVTHFEGISSVENGVYTLNADSVQIGSGAPARGSFVSVVRNTDGSFGDAAWVDLNYPGIDPATNITSSNSVYGNQIVGVVIGTDGTTSYQATVNIGAQLSNVISGNGGNGISLNQANDNQIAMNSIGTDVTGTSDLGNAGNGIMVAFGSSGNLIGGSATAGNDPTAGVFARPPQGNLISGNDQNGVLIFGGATLNTLSGNFIGTDMTGNTALGNTLDGVAIENSDGNSLIGCTFQQDPFVFYNVISGNGGNGLRVTDSDNTTIQANFIGIGADNDTALGNLLNGVVVEGSSANTVMGGPIPLGNVIAANGGNGIVVRDTASDFTTYNTFDGLAAFSDNLNLGNGLDGMLITSTGKNILIRTNVITRNGGNGIHISGAAQGVRVTGNIIGLNTNASVAMGNVGDGVEVDGNAQDIVIGGPQPTFNIIPYNIISANGANGVATGGNAHDIQVNSSYIGTDFFGTAAFGNAKAGVSIGSGTFSTTVGSGDPDFLTIISGNGGNGIEMIGTHDNTVVGSLIGTDKTGSLPLPNAGNGIFISNSSSNSIGVAFFSKALDDANVIAFNGADGVRIDSVNGNSVLGNSIYANKSLGIELAPFANNNQASPVLTSIVALPFGLQIAGNLQSTPNFTFRLEFYANDTSALSGRLFLGFQNVVTDAAGFASFTLFEPLPPSGFNFITATATGTNFNTSEFSVPNSAVITVNTLPAAGDTTVAHGSPPTTFDLGVSNPGIIPITFTVSLLDPLLAIKTQYGLGAAPIAEWFGAHAAGAQYLPRSTGGQLVLRANGDLFIYDGGEAAGGTFITTLPQSVVQNVDLLLTTTGAPLATVANPLYDLKVKYGLDTPAGYFDNAHAKEYYLHSSNNSNPGAANSNDFILTSANTLIARGSNTLVADFTALGLGNVYDTPSLLTGATLGTTVGVTAFTTPAPGATPGGTVTLTPLPGFDRSVIVTVQSVGASPPTIRSFVYSVSDAIPTINPIIDQTGGHNTPLNIPLTVNDSDPDAATRTYTVEFSNPLYDVKTQYGLDTAATAADPTRGYAKFLQSSSPIYPPGANNYFAILPDNKLYKDNGANPRTFVLDLEPYGNVYANPELLTAASKTQPPPTATLNYGQLFDLKTKYGLDTAPIGYNSHGGQELYLNSSNGSNGGAYAYLIKPDGMLYAYDHSGTPTGTLVADVGADVYYNPALLDQATPAITNDQLFDLKTQYGFNTSDAFFDASMGGLEKYLQSSNGSNGGGYSYFLKPDGWLYARAGDAKGVGTKVEEVGTAVYANPGLLYNATGQAPAVTGSVTGGILTLTPNAAFTGIVRVTVKVTDGAEGGTQTFLYTVTNTPPAKVQIPDQSVSALGAAGSIPINLSTAFPDTDALSYTVSVADWLVDLKTKYGITSSTAIFPARDNARFFLGGPGINQGGSSYFLIKPVGGQYQFLASDGSSSGGTVLIADVGAAVYNDPALLTNATTPAALGNVTATVAGNTLTIAWTAGYAGEFRVYLSAIDGDAEARQSFLVTIS
jgi:parallel beta-helix repeat protein